jgi:hypothetical protein
MGWHENNEPVFRHAFFDTTSVTDFVFKDVPTPPPAYPRERHEDNYAWTPIAVAYEERREAFFAHVIKNPSPRGIKGFFYELVRLYKHQPPIHEEIIRAALTYINDRYDCSDFVMLGIMRLLFQFQESPLLSTELVSEARQTILNFKYWPDEPGIDSMCSWTENHQIMFSCNEYLAGQLFSDTIFPNSGMTGHEKMLKARPRILKWLELRFRTGFSEWLSHIYYDEDLTALINLVDFCRDPIILRWSMMVLDLLFMDMALNSFHGTFGSTHGRSYTREKMSAGKESTTDTAKLMFGMGVFSGLDNMSAVCLALSGRYRLPQVISEIANDYERTEMINRQRMGIKIKEADKWGLNLKNPEDVMILLSLEAYTHPLTFARVFDLFDRYRWWENQFFSMFKSKKLLIDILRQTKLDRIFSRILEKDITRNTREEVNIYTYRTPDYMLSSAQDYRKGYGGDQQHIWQATLSPEAVCFSTHPGHTGDTSAGYWIGSGNLPRTAQFKNVLIAVYRISRLPGIYITNRLFFTHAWFPQDKFDEVREEGGWIFGRKGNGYIALYSRNGYRWREAGEYAHREVIAEGTRNIWVCEMGRAAMDRRFDDFIRSILQARLFFAGEGIRYASPSQGLIEFGWDEAMRVKGKAIALDGYPRYENPYSSAPFPPEEITVSHGQHWLKLDFRRGIRDASGL